MSARVTLATTRRVLTQLRRDPRTVVLLVAVPALLIVLLRYVFDDDDAVFNRVGGTLIGLFPFITMFLITSITMLRERTTGTLERLMTLPLGKLDLLLGYALAFALVAAVQATVAALVALWGLGLDVEGPAWVVVLLAVANALLGMSFGLFLSAFARSEFQAVQFMPAFVLPQILLCGLLVAREEMARFLELVSAALPLTYAYDALAQVTRAGEADTMLWVDLGVIAGAIGLALVLGAATLPRRTA
jgi:ABC-2 type transport system permease protein